MSTTSVLRALLLVAGCLPLACAHGARPPPDAAGSPGPVSLRFAWPEALDLFVVVAQESRRPGSEPTGLVARQRLVAERKGGEVWVSTRDVVARGDEPDLEALVRINEALVQVVTPDGRFLRVEGLEEALAATNAASAEAREDVRQALIRSSASDWELLVGAWAGKRLAVGEEHRTQRKASVPLLGLVETLLEVEYGVEAHVPCTEADTVRRCVALSYRARIAPEERTATLARLQRLARSAPDEPVTEDVHAELEVQLVTEPDTLVPHRMAQREHLRLRVLLPDGRVRQAEHRSEDRFVFTTRPPPATEPEAGSRGI